MSLLTRAGDLVYTFRFVKLLATPWEETDAFKLGIIDKNGTRVKSKKVETKEEKTAYTTFHRLVYNIKRLLERVPGGGSRIASYAAALFLLREQFGITDKNLDKIIQSCNLDPLDLISEGNNQWYVLSDKMLSPGIYRVQNEKLVRNTLDELVLAKDKIQIKDNCYPISEVKGVDIYEGTHVRSGQKIVFTLGEIYK
jgi:hypothetical protein